MTLIGFLILVLVVVVLTAVVVWILGQVPGVPASVCAVPLIVSCQPGCTQDGTRILIGSATGPAVVVIVSFVVSCSGNWVSCRTVIPFSVQFTTDAMNRFTYSVSAERK